MKRALLAGIGLFALAVTQPAGAADIPAAMPVKAPVSVAAPLFTWTGFYAGVNAGYGWDGTSFNLRADNDAGQPVLSLVDPRSGSFDISGFVGGVQLGYNWQIDRHWVAGIEADLNYSDVSGSDSVAAPISNIVPIPARLHGERSLEWFGTLRARVGILPSDRLLVFLTGGVAYGRDKAASLDFANRGGGSVITAGLSCLGGTTCLAGSRSQTSTGWSAGAGIEYAGQNNWTFKLEYLHVHLDDQSVRLTAVPPNTGTGAWLAKFDDLAIDVVRVGLNYRFATGKAPGPVVTRY